MVVVQNKQLAINKIKKLLASIHIYLGHTVSVRCIIADGPILLTDRNSGMWYTTEYRDIIIRIYDITQRYQVKSKIESITITESATV